MLKKCSTNKEVWPTGNLLYLGNPLHIGVEQLHFVATFLNFAQTQGSYFLLLNTHSAELFYWANHFRDIYIMRQLP